MNPIEATALELIRTGRAADAEHLLRQNSADRACAARLREVLIGERRIPEAVSVARALAHGDDAEALLSRAFLAHLDNHFGHVVELCQQVLRGAPDHPAALNHLGRALHNMGRSDDAQRAFERAVAVAPGYAQAWHNLGHVLRARGLLERALQAFESALAQAPAYLPARLHLGITWYAMEQPQAALECFQQVLAATPHDVEALVGAGLALHMLGRLDEARAHYQQALQLAPDHATAYYYLGCVLNEAMDSRGAIAALTRALQLQPNDVEAWAELAGVYELGSQLEESARAVQRGLALAPQHPALNLEAAKLERRRGDLLGAVARLQRIDPRQLSARSATQYWFDLGLALDRCDQVDAAMRAFEAGNALAARSVRRLAIDPMAFDRLLDKLGQWTARGAPGALPQPGDPDDDTGSDLCFLVGMPRSGTTLLDTMLAANADVVSIEELPTLEHAIADFAGFATGYPDAMEALSGEDVRALRVRYRQAVAVHLGGRGAKLIVDKLHLRCLHVGLIRRLFPDARILFALRHPGDVVLSNFMQQYAPNDAFVHFDTLADSARVYARVLALWRLSLDVLPLQWDSVRYESLIEDPAGELARVSAFLGIAADPAMLDRQARNATRERVRTNSYQQVAEPIYQRAAGRWQRYRKYLEPCIATLRPAADWLDYRFE